LRREGGHGKPINDRRRGKDGEGNTGPKAPLGIPWREKGGEY